MLKRMQKIALAGALTLAAVAAQADSSFPMFSSVAGALGQSAGNALMSNIVLNEAAKKAGHPTSDQVFKREDKAQGNPKAYEYTFSSAVREQVREEVIDMLIEQGKRGGTMSAEQEKQARDELRKSDVITAVDKALKAKGYNPHSSATALTYWLLVNHNIVNDTVTTDAQDAAVLRQVQQIISETPDANVSDAQKQRESEAMLWLASLQQYAFEEAKKGTPGYDKASVQADARAALKSMGIDADTFTVTDAGLSSK